MKLTKFGSPKLDAPSLRYEFLKYAFKFVKNKSENLKQAFKFVKNKLENQHYTG